MPQLSVTQRAPIAQAGQPIDMDVSRRKVVSAVCAVAIGFGTMLEYVSGTTGGVQPVQDTGTAGTFLPKLAGIAILDPFGREQDYAAPTIPTVLAGTVTTTNNSTALTFTTAQTLAAGQPFQVSNQIGVIYYIAVATSASTSAVMTAKFTGTGAAGLTATLVQAGSSTKGYRAGQIIQIMRNGYIWALGDGGGTATQTGPINVRHSSTGANPQGVFTFTAASTTAGNEIDIAPSCSVFNPTLQGGTGGLVVTDPFGNTNTIYPVEIAA